MSATAATVPRIHAPPRPWRHRAVALWLSACGALGAVGGAGAAEPAATIPYEALYRALSPSLEAQSGSGVTALKVIESKLGVAPEKIHISVHARAGTIELVPRADGTVDFPLTDALRDENPEVTTNQPKGSLTLSVTLALTPPDGAHMSAVAMLSALAKIEAVMRSTSSSAPRIRGVEVRFAPTEAGTVTVRGGSNRFLMADEQGSVVLMRDSDLTGEDIEIEFSTRPLLLMPRL
jgi:hypothetical protein